MKKTLNIEALRNAYNRHAGEGRGLYLVTIPPTPTLVFGKSRGWTMEDCELLTTRKYALAVLRLDDDCENRLFLVRENFRADEWGDGLTTLATGSFKPSAVIYDPANCACDCFFGLCLDCGQWLTSDARHTCGHPSAPTCNDCGTRLTTKEAKEHGVCPECMRKNIARIASYHHRYTRSAGKTFFAQEANRANACHIGVEVELETANGYASPTADIAYFDELLNTNPYRPRIEFESDGSLSGGCEIISQPATAYDYEREGDKWRALYNYANANDYIFGKHNGVHFHLDRAFFGDGKKQLLARFAIEYIIYKHFDFFQAISRRRAGNFGYARKKDSADTLTGAIMYANETTRYHAVNVENCHTIELRFFGGYINTGDDLLACIDLVNALAKWAKWASEGGLGRIEKADLLQMLKHIRNPRNVARFILGAGSYRLMNEASERDRDRVLGALDELITAEVR